MYVVCSFVCIVLCAECVCGRFEILVPQCIPMQ